MNSEATKFEDLINMDNPENVFAEVERVVQLMKPDFDIRPIRIVFDDVLKLFRGMLSGYRACNIRYHDLKHTTDCLLAMARLLHGASTEGLPVSEPMLNLGLISALFHDTGYIQTDGERSGTGAQYTLTHVDRSIEFARHYFAQVRKPESELTICRNFLKCTGLDVNVEDIPFENDEQAFVGKALGAADLLGQMADRTYLERLPQLYREFKEGNVPGFDSELDLLEKTPSFWEFTQQRFRQSLGGVDRFMLPHFKARWGINRDLYRVAIELNISYLNDVLKNHPDDYRRYLRRSEVPRSL